LAIFSAVPPVAAVLSYLLLGAVDLALPKHVWTGLVLLFSAGSFLYVAAVHVLPDVMRDADGGAEAEVYALAATAQAPLGLSRSQVRRRGWWVPPQRRGLTPTHARARLLTGARRSDCAWAAHATAASRAQPRPLRAWVATRTLRRGTVDLFFVQPRQPRMCHVYTGGPPAQRVRAEGAHPP
jgi:hypothetical protein